MASAALTHDNLASAYPDAEAAECDGHGFVNVRYAGETATWRSGNCPVCDRERLRAAVGGFLPPRFRKRIPVPAEITSWADRGHSAQGLYVGGQVGTGKTHAAWMAVGRWCMAASVTPRGEGWDEIMRSRVSPTVVFTRMTDLLDSLRPGDTGTLRVDDCQRARLLVLDDLGAEKASEWTQERIYSVIDHRYANCMPLIVTSNLPPDALAPQIGERAASRLAEMCEIFVPMTGADRRWQS